MILCKCGCGLEIIIKPYHKYYGMPEYIWGHHINDNNPNKPGRPRKFTKNHCDNISKALRGLKKSKEHINKNSDAHKGQIPWNKGKINVYSLNTLEKMSKAKRGRLFSEEHKQKLRGRLPSHGKRTYYNSPLQGIISFRSEWELKYAKYLDEHKILWLYEFQTFDLGDTTYTPDFFLPQFEKFVEIKGWSHQRSKNKINRFLQEYPWNLEILMRDDLIKLGIDIK